MNICFKTSLYSLFFASLIHSIGHACTDFKLVAKDNSLLITRSMEFGVPVGTNLRTATRNKSYSTVTTSGKPGLSWHAKYGYVYLDGFGQDLALDGMNEAGLTFEYLYLPSETQYQTLPPGKENQGVPYDLFGNWVLSNFSTIDEVKKALGDIYVYPRTLPGLGSEILPAHASIYDSSGKGIVVEFVKGKVNVYDNIGIMTNSPQYGWHITNLRNYLNLSPNNPNPISAGNMTFSTTGQGAGMVGLPGDFSPPSRFVKIAFMTHYAFQANNATDLLNLAQHIINNVDIPAGVARTSTNGSAESDNTQWVVFKDITNKKIYYRTYDDLTLRGIDMSKLDFSENAPLLKMQLAGKQSVVDATTQFLSSH